MHTSRQAAQRYMKPIDTIRLLLDMTLPTGETSSSSIDQNTGASPPNQETFTGHWPTPPMGDRLYTYKELPPWNFLSLSLFFNHTSYFPYILLPLCWPSAVLWIFLKKNFFSFDFLFLCYLLFLLFLSQCNYSLICRMTFFFLSTDNSKCWKRCRAKRTEMQCWRKAKCYYHF